jgi:hypothetical protein
MSNPQALDDANGENPLRGIVAESLEAALGIFRCSISYVMPLRICGVLSVGLPAPPEFHSCRTSTKDIVEISLEFQVVWRLRCRPAL